MKTHRFGPAFFESDGNLLLERRYICLVISVTKSNR